MQSSLPEQQRPPLIWTEPADREVHARAIFIRVAKLNHSCAPNCAIIIDPRCQPAYPLQLVTLRDIPQGEELTVAYEPVRGLSLGARRAILQRRFAFVCQCGVCRFQGIYQPSRLLSLLAVCAEWEL